MAESVKYVVARIRQALAEDPRTNILDVQVNITAGRVYLFGPIDSRERKRFAEEVTRELVPQDMTVVNDLWITSYSQEPNVESLP